MLLTLTFQPHKVSQIVFCISIINTFFTQELEGTRRGRPKKGWKEEVERDLQVLGVRR